MYRSYPFIFLAGTVLCVVLFIINIGIGSVYIPFGEIVVSLTGGEFSRRSW
jgi:iron complex transport system permease protein